MAASGPKPDKMLTCRNCGKSFISYGKLSFPECPHCGMPLDRAAPPPEPVRKRRNAAYVFLALGIVILVIMGVVLAMRR